jgi:hypothetical protein
MIRNVPTSQEALTRDRWVRIVSDCRQGYWPPPRLRERRGGKRVGLGAVLARITFRSPGDSEKLITYPNCPILDASVGSLAMRTCQKIAVGTPLSLEIGVGGKTFVLTGRVVSSTGFPGAVRLGVALEFPAPTGDSSHSVG